ncbi:MAG: hypothetical protein HUU21_04980 [Polyangiaceae bacterium]|nr:hypothetical protein [Polyangiaceae bacterium]
MATEEPYSVELWVTPRAGPGSRVFDLELYDHQRKGWAAAGVARLDFFEDPETASFLNAFLRGDSVRVRDGLLFGRELGARLFAREELGQGFHVVEQRRGGRPISRLQLFVRNQVMKLLGIPFVAKVAIGRSLVDKIELPDYGHAPA